MNFISANLCLLNIHIYKYAYIYICVHGLILHDNSMFLTLIALVLIYVPLVALRLFCNKKKQQALLEEYQCIATDLNEQDKDSEECATEEDNEESITEEDEPITNGENTTDPSTPTKKVTNNATKDPIEQGKTEEEEILRELENAKSIKLREMVDAELKKLRVGITHSLPGLQWIIDPAFPLYINVHRRNEVCRTIYSITYIASYCRVVNGTLGTCMEDRKLKTVITDFSSVDATCLLDVAQLKTAIMHELKLPVKIMGWSQGQLLP